MDQLLDYLSAHLSRLYKDFGFRIVDSAHSASFGGNGFITLCDGYLKIKLTRDRGQLFADFASSSLEDVLWFDSAILREYITGEKQNSSVLSTQHEPEFVSDLERIKQVLAPENRVLTMEGLNKLKAARADRIFGKM